MFHNNLTTHRLSKNTAFHSGENRLVYFAAENPEDAESGKRANPLAVRAFVFALLVGGLAHNVFTRGCGESKPEPTPVTQPAKPVAVKNLDNVSRRQQTAINVDGVLNGKNITRMGKMGIKFPNWMYDYSDSKSPLRRSIDSYLICLDGAGCDDFLQFRQRVMDMLQPKDVACAADTPPDECEKTRERNSSVMLSLSAIGGYQALLWHHGEHLKGWKGLGGNDWQNADWKGNMNAMFNLINNVDIQQQVADGIIKKLFLRYKGDVKDISAAYYSGQEAAGVLGYSVQVLKRLGRWVKGKLGIGGAKSSNANYKLPNEYAKIVVKCFKKKTDRKIAQDTPEDLTLLRRCIFSKETGGAGKVFKGRKSGTIDELVSKWGERGVKLDPELEKRWRNVGVLDDTSEGVDPNSDASVPSDNTTAKPTLESGVIKDL